MPGALECGSCHALVHASRLEQLGASARLHEERREAVEASATWSRVLELLPPDSAQAEWVRGRIERLASAMANTPTVDARRAWIRKLGPLAPVAILLVNGKYLLALFKLKFLLSLAAFVTFYWALYGVKFGVGFAILILLHEMGHFVDIKRRGLPADMPVFLPGLGAYVRWSALGVPARTRALVSLAGPLAGCIGAAACALLWSKTGDALWIGLASVSALLNLLNLVPIWVLDGAQAIAALDRTERILLSAAAVVFAAAFGQPVFLLVAAGAGYRLFTRDIPASPDHAVMVYYLLVLTALGFLIALAPPPPVHS
ncbi:MAG: site-2 protease family protein [Gammaproteobacteria bacterium]|nr:MAG: site-2 protease family protein [Gammaproteobacteria bacterium]TLZ07901.1 MAG: site-2 protease family protein [Gammaproteobacteria bacterium]